MKKTSYHDGINDCRFYAGNDQPFIFSFHLYAGNDQAQTNQPYRHWQPDNKH